ncbi:ABC transporter ATP-binding protein [Actinotalea sp. M2MS4P-6]|uniref:ABC transporter ATP-binding protein n=1 Tax=Actinotalea sp. M2MS4P-6 TaxID=2983762 RepID=UPI0021E3B954|nr:ABC transporter ATP-binding protein [Actinotalea sp. M2MS4P-6]MCV2393881.1 ABC transporter ATP-binding protein [Actinotalea sp. M2MS4P-6]
MTVMDAEIRCEDLVRIFTAEGVEVQALQGLNLTVEAGDLVALVGASGSGKSTLLTILSGLDRPTAGAASVAGHDLVTMTPGERQVFRRDTVGFVWQQTARNLLPYLTAVENVTLPMVLGRRRSDRAARRARAAELLDVLGVADVADRRPAELSGGEQQRVAIATAVANGPRVLLADEPTGELDEATSADVLDAIRHVTTELGMTTLIVTHDPAVATHVRRTVRIRDGRTATETLRRTALDEHGHELHVHEEFAVIDRVGRLQLPREFVDALDLRDRVRLGLETDHVRVSSGTQVDAGTGADPGAAPERPPGAAAEPSTPDGLGPTGDHREPEEDA